MPITKKKCQVASETFWEEVFEGVLYKNLNAQFNSSPLGYVSHREVSVIQGILELSKVPPVWYLMGVWTWFVISDCVLFWIWCSNFILHLTDTFLVFLILKKKRCSSWNADGFFALHILHDCDCFFSLFSSSI